MRCTICGDEFREGDGAFPMYCYDEETGTFDTTQVTAWVHFGHLGA